MASDTYKSLSTQVYDIVHSEVTSDKLEYYLKQKGDSAKAVLEPMCGSGRYLIPFMERGIDIDGVDNSPDMLQACQERCREKGLKPRLYLKSIDELSLPRKYGYIFIPEGSFSLITSEAVVLKSLNSFYEHLLPKSKLAIEVFTPKAGINAGGRKTKDWFRVSDTTFVSASREISYDPVKQIQRCISSYEMVKEGYSPAAQIETIEIRLYEIEQFRSLLDKAGFSFITVEGKHENNSRESENISVVFTGIKT